VSDENKNEVKSEEVESSSGSSKGAGGNRLSSIYRTYRSEFKKIVWPSRKTTFKHTVTVIVVSLIFGAFIALSDYGYSFLYRQFVYLVGGN